MEEKPAPQSNPVVVIKTTKGDITLELYQDKAPISVENFLGYVEDGHYKGTIFHRVISSFMIQGGGFTADGKQKPTKKPIKNEAANGLKNKRSTVAMARTSSIDSATCQFFINVVDNPFLDHKNTSQSGFGYCVFGNVVDGLDVVEEMRSVPTGQRGPHGDWPKKTIEILDVVRAGGDE